jgi:hypothetical protein
MRRWIKWLLIPVVVVAALVVVSPKSAEAICIRYRAYRPYYGPTYVYRYPRRVYYYAPAPVVVYRPPTYFYGPPLLPPPVPYGCWW